MKYFFGGLLLLALLIGVYVAVDISQIPVNSAVITSSNKKEPDVTITRTDRGYVPNEVVIRQGDVVEWVNDSHQFHWPASNDHPSHLLYPEFDPKRPIAPGESWTFQFDKVGEWGYHDHLKANVIGSVIVTDENGDMEIETDAVEF